MQTILITRRYWLFLAGIGFFTQIVFSAFSVQSALAQTPPSEFRPIVPPLTPQLNSKREYQDESQTGSLIPAYSGDPETRTPQYTPKYTPSNQDWQGQDSPGQRNFGNNDLRSTRNQSNDGQEIQPAYQNHRFYEEESPLITKGEFGRQQNESEGLDEEYRSTNETPSGNQSVFDRGLLRSDSMVQPAGFLSEPATLQQLATELLKSFDINLIQDTLPGDPITLVDAVAQSQPGYRNAVVDAYWQTYCDYVRVRLAEQEQSWLGRLRSPTTQTDELLFQALSINAENRTMQAKLNFQKSSGNLSRYLPENSRGLPPLPADMPLLGEYRTNFEHYQARQPMPRQTRLINERLPKEHAMIHAHARACQVAQQSVNQTIRAYNQGETSLATPVEAIRLSRDIHGSFLDAVKAYNQSTAEYASVVAPFGQPPNRFVSMLIKSNPTRLESFPELREARNDPIFSNPPQRFDGSLQPGFGNQLPDSSQAPSFQGGSGTMNPQSWDRPSNVTAGSTSNLGGQSPSQLPPSLPPSGGTYAPNRGSSPNNFGNTNENVPGFSGSGTGRFQQ